MDNLPAQNLLAHSQYLLSRKIKLSIDEHFTITDPTGTPILFVSKKGFKLKEEIHVFGDEARTRRLMTIQARQVIDFSATYDVTDGTTGQRVGSLRRKGLHSMFRDQWLVFDETEREIGTIIEDSMAMALLRRFLTNLIPQNYDVLMEGQVVADLRQRFNPFLYKLEMDFRMDGARRLDRRLGLAAGILLATIEGRQRS